MYIYSILEKYIKLVELKRLIGLVTCDFYEDLTDKLFETHIAMVHSRFSTNTFPSWDRAQPNRFMSHNGEINTLLGNVNAMNARQGVISDDYYKGNIEKLFPIVE